MPVSTDDNSLLLENQGQIRGIATRRPAVGLTLPRCGDIVPCDGSGCGGPRRHEGTHDLALRRREAPHRRPGDRLARHAPACAWPAHAYCRCWPSAARRSTGKAASSACRASSSNGPSPAARARSSWPELRRPTTSCSAPDQPFRFSPSGCVAKTLDFRTRRAPPEHPAGPARVHGAESTSCPSSTSCGPRSAPPTCRSSAASCSSTSRCSPRPPST